MTVSASTETKISQTVKESFIFKEVDMMTTGLIFSCEKYLNFSDIVCCFHTDFTSIVLP